MPHNLQRHTGRGDLHYITFSCYQRRHFLESIRSKNLTVRILGEVRGRYKFALIGYVFMPDHVHLLISEAPGAAPATVIQVFKQRVARELRGRKESGKESFSSLEIGDIPRAFWQRRYYDFNIYSRDKLVEKLDYMHANPVKEGLVQHPKDWPWSSWAAYAGKPSLLAIDFVE